ncbi:pyruvate kinase [Anaerofilum sp. BX8]|uniref:Pyruvate kinase n=1 Tax=Anaerofilum hominis TaxID=2763016 RepID=A0A923L1Q4_9FIRM|nr:pyruvate kinase [Anaerofilum hominis]MBC5582231.1 pyruvate kinase [Anaerofilum hominis]
MRKTKIICTLGPSTDSEEILRQMAAAGMNVARFNFSHGSYEEHLARLNLLRKVRNELEQPIAALLDTKGPEIRLRDFKGGKVFLKAGSTFVLTTREVEGTEEICSITYRDLPQDVKVGTRLLLDDGLISMVVSKIEGSEITCSVQNSGYVSNHKSVNVPGVRLSMPYLSKQDEKDILFGIENGFDFIAASFVRCARDVLDIREVLDRHKCDHIRIIAKIENSDGVQNIEEILAVSDGVMVARGDMGVEIDFTEIPIIQKNIIWHCYNSGKPAITATQMLESMMNNPRPTRAEITDVANAIYDGTSAIMLSGETAAGKFPVEAVKTMAAIAERTEADINYDKRLRNRGLEDHMGIADAMAHAACTTAMDIRAKAIVTVSKSGETARLLCKYRPTPPIIACVTSEQVYRHLSLSWGIVPMVMPLVKTTDDLIDTSAELAQKAGYLKEGDMAVITAGVPVGVSGSTNMIKAHLVGASLLSGVGVGKLVGVGRICICKTEAEIRSKFHPGDVLVLPSTSNDILDQMKKASAIICEEPGLNSHAAIVGLTLEKPVIVGATGATHKLKDGVKVAVDAERGIVRVMPQ